PCLGEVYEAGDGPSQLGQQGNEEVLEGHDQARRGHDEGSPHQGPVFHLLHVAEAAEQGLVAGNTEIVEEVGVGIGEVSPAGKHVAEELAAAPGEGEISYVEGACEDHDARGDAMGKAARVERMI